MTDAEIEIIRRYKQEIEELRRENVALSRKLSTAIGFLIPAGIIALGQLLMILIL